MTSRSSTIADAILRFRQSPPRSREERQREQNSPSPSKFWWQNQTRHNVPAINKGRTESEAEPTSSGSASSKSDISITFEGTDTPLASSVGLVPEVTGVQQEKTVGEEVGGAVDEPELTTTESEAEVSPPREEESRCQVEEAELDETSEVDERVEESEQGQGQPEELAVSNFPATIDDSEDAAGVEPVPTDELESEGSKLALETLAAQHPKLFRALQSKVRVATDVEEPNKEVHSDVLGSSLDSVDTLDTVVGETLDNLEDVVDENEILAASEDDDLEDDDEMQNSGGSQGHRVEQEPTTPTLGAIQDVLRDSLEGVKQDASDASREEGTSPGQSFGEELKEEEADSEAQSNDKETSEESVKVGVPGDTEDEDEGGCDGDATSEDDLGDYVRKVLTDIEDQVGIDLFNTADLATNLELQAMIRKQIEAAQQQASPLSRGTSIASVPSTPEVGSTPSKNLPLRSSGSLEGVLEKYEVYSGAATLIQKAYKSYREKKNRDEKLEKREKETEDELKEYLSKCTGSVDALWSEISGLLANFPMICIQLFQDSLLMKNKMSHHELEVDDVIKVLASMLPIDSRVQAYMEAIFQADKCDGALTTEQLHSRALNYLSLGKDYEPDPSWKPQLKSSLVILKSEEGKHVFQQLDMDRTSTFNLPRIACAFDILFEDSPDILRGLCKQLIHRVASEGLQEITYNEVTKLFEQLGNLRDDDEADLDPEAEGQDAAESQAKVEGSQRQMEMERMFDDSIEKNIKDIEAIYDQIGEENDEYKNDGDEDDDKSESGGSMKEIIGAIENMPTSDIEELQEEFKEVNASIKIEDDPESKDEEGTKPSGSGSDRKELDGDGTKLEDPAPAEEGVLSETKDSSTQFAEDDIGLNKENISNESNPEAEQSAGKNYELPLPMAQTQTPVEDELNLESRQKGSVGILNKAVDRVRLAKKLEKQKKIKDNLFVQIGNLCIDELKHKLPDKCRLKESLEGQERRRVSLDVDSKPSYSRGNTPVDELPRQARPVMPDDVAPGGQSYSSGWDVRYDNPGRIDHSRLSEVSGRICKDLDSLLTAYENRVSPGKYAAALQPPQQPPPQSVRSEQKPKEKKQNPFYTFPYYGAGQFGMDSQSSFFPSAKMQSPPSTYPLELGPYGHSVQSDFITHTRSSSNSYSVEDRFQYLSKHPLGGDTAGIFSMHKVSQTFRMSWFIIKWSISDLFIHQNVLTFFISLNNCSK